MKGVKIYAAIMIALGLFCIVVALVPPYVSTTRIVLYSAVGLWSIYNGVRRLRR
ncbi:hypothetical protein A8990_110115 [Paenibacillus taihuensis]|uniref:Uncharacterized protein n=1 Tax=Paenibacillus taihuensis TaxID=1156355 RepID=A0A3D9S1P7_9BACL|nr:hypothetical protein [Paenibacillus taihuensis]REE86506.1 hypothetical protein A8990_110115 [Paenibacillus taihuensis]